MNLSKSILLLKRFGIFALFVLLVVAAVFSSKWYPQLNQWVQSQVVAFRGEEEGNEENEDHDEHAHGDHGHSEEVSIEITEKAMRNIGLTRDLIQPIKLETFYKSITVPAIVVERPGRTRVQVSTPMTGVVTHVEFEQGEAVKPGSMMFQIRLTHEDLVQAQTAFLRTLGELDVEVSEIERLQKVTKSGAIAGKILLEREYAHDKLIALKKSQKEALRLHGLSDEQVNQIEKSRKLLSELKLFAPTIDMGNEEAKELSTDLNDRSLILKELNVHKGQSVNAGESLSVMAAYNELYIEGNAFEQDIEDLRKVWNKGWGVTAIFERPGADSDEINNLSIVYLANQIETQTRTLHFYVQLMNEVASPKIVGKKTFIEWKYLPGQRLRLKIPIHQWENQIVLPVAAVAQEGSSNYVFQQNGKKFNRIPVHVKFRDQYSVVIENDGALFPGDMVALKGAHLMLIDLKNKAGGAVDPHAGHNH